MTRVVEIIIRILMLGVLAFVFFVFACSCLGCASLPAPLGHLPVSPAARLAGAVNSTSFMIPLAILGVALGVTATFTGVGKIGLPAIIGSLTALILTLAMDRYASLLAALGAIAAVIALIAGIIWKYRNVAGTALNMGTALQEVVGGVEKVKTYVVDKLGGKKEDINQTLASEQSPTTQQLVQDAKAQATAPSA